MQLKSPDLTDIAYFMNITGNIEFGSDVMTGVNYYGVSEKFPDVQPVSRLDQVVFFAMKIITMALNFIVMGYIDCRGNIWHRGKSTRKNSKIKKWKRSNHRWIDRERRTEHSQCMGL